MDGHQQNGGDALSARCNHLVAGGVQQPQTTECSVGEVRRHIFRPSIQRNIDLGGGGHQVLGGHAIHEQAGEIVVRRNGEDSRQTPAPELPGLVLRRREQLFGDEAEGTAACTGHRPWEVGLLRHGVRV